MSTAREVVTAAFQLAGVMDINEAAPQPAEMEFGMKLLTGMLDSWSAQGLKIESQTIAGTVTAGSAIITDLASTAGLVPGVNVAGTGIVPGSRILTVDSLTQITMDTNAIAPSGSAVSLQFAALPFQDKFEEGVIALLAKRITARPGMGAMTVMGEQMASTGWAALCAHFAPIPNAQFDQGLLATTQTARQGASYDGTNG